MGLVAQEGVYILTKRWEWTEIATGDKPGLRHRGTYPKAQWVYSVNPPQNTHQKTHSKLNPILFCRSTNNEMFHYRYGKVFKTLNR